MWMVDQKLYISTSRVDPYVLLRVDRWRSEDQYAGTECVGARTTSYRQSYDMSGRSTALYICLAVRVRRFRWAWPAHRMNTRTSPIRTSVKRQTNLPRIKPEDWETNNESSENLAEDSNTTTNLLTEEQEDGRNKTTNLPWGVTELNKFL
jgi:hypothetical protein